MGIMGILIGVLKIIGIIILAIVTIALFLIAIVLFVPIVYRIKLLKHEDVDGEVYVRWLYGAIGLRILYKGGNIKASLIVFGKDLSKGRRKKKKQKSGNKERKDLKRKTPQNVKKEETAQKPKKVEAATLVEATVRQEEPRPEGIMKEEIIEKEIIEANEAFQNSKKEKQSGLPMYKRVSMKEIQIKEVPHEETEEEGVAETAEEESTEEDQKIDKDYFLKLPFEEKKELIGYGFRFIRRILKEVMPESVRIDATVGTGDPETTGYVLALAGGAKGLINPKINVRGKFDEAFFEGDIELDGIITVITIVIEAIRLIKEKPIRKIIKILLKGKGE